MPDILPFIRHRRYYLRLFSRLLALDDALLFSTCCRLYLRAGRLSLAATYGHMPHYYCRCRLAHIRSPTISSRCHDGCHADAGWLCQREGWLSIRLALLRYERRRVAYAFLPSLFSADKRHYRCCNVIESRHYCHIRRDIRQLIVMAIQQRDAITP